MDETGREGIHQGSACGAGACWRKQRPQAKHRGSETDMKKASQRLSSPRHSARKKRPPITAADVESGLDILADVMAKAGPRAHLGIPLWKRLERELERLRDEEAVLAAARERVRRSRDRIAG